MYADRKAKALANWQKLLERPEIRMTPEEQYEELLRLAEEYLMQEFIDHDERKLLITEATKRYAEAVEGLNGGR